MKYYKHLLLFISVLCLVCSLSFSCDNEIEKRFIEAGLVDIKSIDDTLQVDLVNSNPAMNYFRENFYDNLTTAYLQKEIGIKLSGAQKNLKKQFPDYSLLVLDAARPRSVSKRMYEKMKGARYEKYVANPDTGSMHNYGIAVDITVVDENGKELDMGYSPFRKNRIELFWMLAKRKMGFKVTEKQKKNRQLLHDVMVQAGFLPLKHEWWHFNGLSQEEVRQRFKIIE